MSLKIEIKNGIMIAVIFAGKANLVSAVSIKEGIVASEDRVLEAIICEVNMPFAKELTFTIPH